MPDLWVVCGRPGCGRALIANLNRGRHRAYCDDACRRAAGAERRKIVTEIGRLERRLRRLQHQLATFGPDGDSE